MDMKLDIKEEDSLSYEVASQNECHLFIKNVIMKSNGDAVLLNDDMAIETDIKSEVLFPDYCTENKEEYFSTHFIQQIKPEAVTCGSICMIDTKTEIDLQKERAFLPEDTVHEMDNKIEVKEESWCLERETSSAYDDIKDETGTPIKSQRLCTEGGSGGTSMPFAEASGKNTSYSYAKDCPETETQETDVTNVLTVEKHVHSEQFGKFNDVLIHKVERPGKCNICVKSFTMLSSLKLHNLIHEGKKLHKCEICEKRFTRLSHLKRHNLIHEGKKPHKCKICDKSFIQLSSLKLHTLIHEGKKLYKCEICETSFTQLSHLKVHNLIHEGKKPHRCEVCEKSFAQLSNLKRHNLMHEGKKLHKCNTCEKSFTRLSHLKRHNLIHEGKTSVVVFSEVV